MEQKQNDLIQCISQVEIGSTNFEHTFNFNNLKVRMIILVDEPYFCGKDIASILGYEDTNKAIRMHIREKHKFKFCDLIKLGPAKTAGPNMTYNEGQMIYISEPGFYSLVLRSRAPLAEKFQDVVTEQILPSIRKTGEFKMNQLLESEREKVKLLEEKDKEKDAIIKKQQEDAQFTYKISNSQVSLKKFTKNNESKNYAGSTRDDKNNFTKKISTTTNLKKRVGAHNTAHVSTDPFVIDNECIVFDDMDMHNERFIHAHLEPFNIKTPADDKKGSKEYFLLHDDLAYEVMEKVTNLSNEICNIVNERIDLLNENNRNYYDIEDIIYEDDEDEVIEEIIIVKECKGCKLNLKLEHFSDGRNYCRPCRSSRKNRKTCDNCNKKYSLPDHIDHCKNGFKECSRCEKYYPKNSYKKRFNACNRCRKR
jgi:prophage antirepressor-like protein